MSPGPCCPSTVASAWGTDRFIIDRSGHPRGPAEKGHDDIMGLLTGKTLLVTGVLMDSSIAFHVARLAQDEGATVILTSFGRTMKITSAIAKRLPQTPPVVELDVAASARLTYLSVQDLGRGVWQIGTQASRVAGQAQLVSTTAAFGGAYARLRTDCALAGRGATGDLFAVYFGDGDQTLDFRTFQDHLAPDTTSNLLFKGTVGGHARSVYTGLIRVRPDARGTNAFQTNRNIKLSDHAWAESVPNLEIENNDVHCSHASAVGPIDEQQRFYLESRGVPPFVAERLVVAGFFTEVLEQISVAPLVAELRRRISDKLESPLD